jgi:hypothetical protein
MITKVTKIKVEPTVDELNDVVTHVTLLMKEFDDSDVDYSVNTEAVKPISFKRTYALKQPNKYIFTDIDNVNESVALEWVKQIPLFGEKLEELFNKRVEEIKAFNLKRKALKERRKEVEEKLKNKAATETSPEANTYEITF